MWATLREKLLLQRHSGAEPAFYHLAFYKRLSTFVVTRLTAGAHMDDQRRGCPSNGFCSDSDDERSKTHSYTWHPNDIIHAPHAVGNGFGCLVLNRSVSIPPEVAQQIWQNAYVRCLVDGGTNRWRHFLQTHCQGRQLKPPELVSGDFDSITDETRAYFSDPVTKYVHTPEQDDTDFTKALRLIRPLLEQQQLHNIIVFHDSSGRFDHIMANINTLFKLQSSTLHVYLLSGWSIAWLMRPGKHSIVIPPELVAQQRWCSLIPVGGRVRNVTSSGLKWNLSNSVLEFGGMVSTSNTYAAEHVHIETSGPLIWSMGVWQAKDD